MANETFDDFKKKNPHLDGFWPYLDKLKEESDRDSVLISTGYLEQQLKEILLAFMLDDKKVESLVDGGYAPLGAFSSRITACYAFGLITPDEHHDLHQLRKVRNDFAHNMQTSFETQMGEGACPGTGGPREGPRGRSQRPCEPCRMDPRAPSPVPPYHQSVDRGFDRVKSGDA